MKQSKIVVCDNFWSTDTNKCNGRFCTNCCKRHYDTNISHIETLDSWSCFKCESKCVCAACRRERNGTVPENKRKITSEKKARPKKVNKIERDPIKKTINKKTQTKKEDNKIKHIPPKIEKNPPQNEKILEDMKKNFEEIISDSEHCFINPSFPCSIESFNTEIEPVELVLDYWK